MLSTQQDQENLVAGHHQVTAAKPLNQSLRGLGSRTPASKNPKTPFKIPLNDENTTFGAGKSVLKTNGKGNENAATARKKGDQEKNAFVTPAAPRTARAPLGMKTTNAKGQAFQTPAPPTIDPTSAKAQQQSRSPRLRRGKVKIHQPELEIMEEQDDVPEPEGIPPKQEALPDHPPDFPPDCINLSMFEGKNMTRGVFSTYMNPVDDNGVSKWEREDAEAGARFSKKIDDDIAKSLETTDKEIEEMQREFEKAEGMCPPKVEEKPQPQAKTSKPSATRKSIQSSRTSTLASRSAAKRLSQPSKSGAPSFAAPTAATKSKVQRPILGRVSSNKSAKPSSAEQAASRAPKARQNLAGAASNTTLGYSAGRAASSVLRTPLSNVKNTTQHSRATSTASTAGKRQAKKPLSRAHSRQTSTATVTPSRFAANEAKENQFTYADEAKAMEELRRKEYCRDDDDEMEEMMKGWGSDRLALGDEAFEEFRFDVPELGEEIVL